MTDVHRRARYLGLQIAGLIVAMLAVVSVLTLTVYERTEHHDANSTLRAAAARLTVDQVPPGFWMTVENPGSTADTSGPAPVGLPLTADLQRVLTDRRPVQRELNTTSGTWFVRTEPRGTGVVQVAMDSTASEKATERVITALLISAGLGVVLAGGIAALLARRAIAPITEALAMQRRFVADAGHELRTPLTLLSTRVQMLSRRLSRDPATPPEVRADVAGVVDDTAALTSILEELLLAAQSGSPPERTPEDLATLVLACVDAAGASATERGMDLVVRTADRGEVPLSSGAVRRAVTSLIDNALDHARSSVVVDVLVRRKDARVVVTDDGPGVRPPDAERIFERFASFRPGEVQDAVVRAVPDTDPGLGDPSASGIAPALGSGTPGTSDAPEAAAGSDTSGAPDEAGASGPGAAGAEALDGQPPVGGRRNARRHYGLGLALVADVAAAHGGTVAVTSRPDGRSGAVFVLTLPR